MRKAKQFPEAAKALLEYFNKEEVGDTELQRRYEGYKDTQERTGIEVQALMDVCVALEESLNNIRELILRNACLQIIDVQQLKMSKDIQDNLNKEAAKLSKCKAKYDEATKHIQQLDDITVRKIWCYWRALRVLDSTTPSLSDFKELYKGKIF